ncbi:hypothetical protein [Natronorubrum halophilum]|uniref:hypothetical protein n=1 Tax=Natronorubrum halophilum TaxID=1702106 RepID=UPI0010C1819C|nr:hypothetical protein [Natronorubrum halophilum]
MKQTLTATLDFRGYPVDWDQSVDILETGGLEPAYQLRDSQSGVTVEDESYLQARRKLTLARNIKRETEDAVARCLSRELAHHCAGVV